MNTIITTLVLIAFTYCLFVNDKEEYDEPEEPKPKNKKYIKVKRNGEWVDEEIE